MKRVRHQGDTRLPLVLLLRAASGLIANYLFCASLAAFLCRACHWLLCGRIPRAVLSGPMLIIEVGNHNCPLFNPGWVFIAARENKVSKGGKMANLLAFSEHLSTPRSASERLSHLAVTNALMQRWSWLPSSASLSHHEREQFTHEHVWLCPLELSPSDINMLTTRRTELVRSNPKVLVD